MNKPELERRFVEHRLAEADKPADAVEFMNTVALALLALCGVGGVAIILFSLEAAS